MSEMQDAMNDVALPILDMYSAIVLESLLKERDEAREQTEEARKWAIYYKKKYEGVLEEMDELWEDL